MFSMQPTFARLMLAANALKKVSGPAAVGRLIGESEQTMSNWRMRGVPKAKHIDLAMPISNVIGISGAVGADLGLRSIM